MPFARPRDRAALNNSPAYKRLRAAVTQYLMDVGVKRAVEATRSGELPNVAPVTFDSGPPRAFREAAASPIDQRYVEFYEVTKVYPTPKGPLTVVDKFNLDAPGRVRLADRPFRLRQVDGAVDGRRAERRFGGGIVLDGREVAWPGPTAPWCSRRRRCCPG